MQEFINNAIVAPLQDLLAQFYSFLPNFFAMLLILMVGFILGFLIKKVIIVSLKLIKFDRLSFRLGIDNILAKAGIRHKPTEVVGIFVYWLLFFVFIMLALNALKVEALNNLVSQFFLFVPNLLAGFILFFVGYLISILFYYL